MTIKIDQIADAISAVPGVAIVLFNGQPATTQTISSGTFADIPGSALPEQFFTAPVAGVYVLSIETGVLSSGTLNQWDTAQYQLVVDAGGYGGFTEQIIGNTTVDYEWKVGVRNYTAAQQQPEYKHITAFVTLEAGYHKIKWQAKTSSGSPVVNNSINFKITGVLVSGSGAGGVIVTEQTDDQARTGTGATPTEVAQLQLSITTFENEYVDLRFIGRTSPTSTTDTPQVYYKIDAGSWVMMSQESSSVNSAINSAWAAMVQFPAGSHTVSIGLQCYSANAWALWGQYGCVSRFQAIQYRGGYSQPDNDPILQYNSASVVDVTNKLGASPELFVTLNDGVKRRNIGTLTVDLTVSGRGGLDTGSEAISTWYYLYLVPNVAGTGLSAVASVIGPATGPTGFSVWKYIGFIRNDSGGDILRFKQTGPSFDFVNLQAAYNGSSVAAFAWTSLSLVGVVPVTASIAKVYATSSADAGVWQYYTLGAVTAKSKHILSNEGDSTLSGEFEIPLFETQTMYHKLEFGAGSSALVLGVYVNGCIDAYLS